MPKSTVHVRRPGEKLSLTRPAGPPRRAFVSGQMWIIALGTKKCIYLDLSGGANGKKLLEMLQISSGRHGE